MKNSDVARELLDGINYLINSALKKTSFDITKDGIVTNVNSDNTYNVSVNNYTYQNLRCLNGVSLSVGNVVKIIIPSNQKNNIFILGKLN